MNDDLREMYLVRPTPLKISLIQKTPNSIASQAYFKAQLGQENNSAFDNYNYTSRVQASQIRNAYSEL
jgi:hypothetical protein